MSRNAEEGMRAMEEEEVRAHHRICRVIIARAVVAQTPTLLAFQRRIGPRRSSTVNDERYLNNIVHVCVRGSRIGSLRQFREIIIKRKKENFCHTL